MVARRRRFLPRGVSNVILVGAGGGRASLKHIYVLGSVGEPGSGGSGGSETTSGPTKRAPAHHEPPPPPHARSSTIRGYDCDLPRVSNDAARSRRSSPPIFAFFASRTPTAVVVTPRSPTCHPTAPRPVTPRPPRPGLPTTLPRYVSPQRVK